MQQAFGDVATILEKFPGERVPNPDPDPALRRIDADEVTRAALDSFPASDPPGWPGLRLGPPAATLEANRGATVEEAPGRLDELPANRGR